MTLAGWLRNLSLGLTPIKKADPSLIRYLRRIGSNLKQVAKHTNIKIELDQSILRMVLVKIIEQNLE